MQLSRTLARWFPVPRILSPNASGVDITDASVKWLTLAPAHAGYSLVNYGSQTLSDGIVRMGAVRDPAALAEALKDVKKRTKISSAHAALPEEGAYVFGMQVHSGSSRHEITSMIEFELEGRVPIPPKQAVYDFDFLGSRGERGNEIAVTVFPREIAEGYIEAFSKAGIELVSLEIEARSIARAVSGRSDPTTLLVDCGKARTGVAIIKNGIPIFTSTVEIGGEHMSQAVVGALNISEEEAQNFKNEHGLVADDPKTQKGFEAVDKVASGLADEIARHYRFWDTRRESDSHSGVERVFLVGGSVNLKGFPEYIAGKVHAFTERPNVWRNVMSFDDYIPPIPYRASFQYATAIGLALRGQ